MATMTANAPLPGKDLSKFNAIVDDAVAAAPAMMATMVSACSRSLYDRELKARSVHEREALSVSGKLLKTNEAALCAEFGLALRRAIVQAPTERKRAPQALESLSLDQLELMDEDQVQESVALARAQQSTILVAEANLNDLNTLVCSALGHAAVRTESNPLRPQTYVVALKDVLDHLAVPPAARQDWFAVMSTALGPELRNYYALYADKLRAQGVVAAGYMVVPSPGQTKAASQAALDRPEAQASAYPASAVSTPRQDTFADSWGRGGSAPAAPMPMGPSSGRSNKDDALLTLDTLRRLLSGELDNIESAALSPAESFAQRFSREFESGESQPVAPVSDFASTVPAAFEALSEMRQVDRVVRKLQERQGAQAKQALPTDNSIDAVRQVMRRHAKGLAQALSLEVVQLMLDNLARDPRLLKPVQDLVRSMEPAMLRLSLVDPRFFSDKQHPARELLLQITQRSLAFDHPQAKGLTEFLAEVHAEVDPLSLMHIEDASPFQQALNTLTEKWQQAQQKQEAEQAKVVAILQHAEARNLLAEKIAHKVESHPDAAMVPAVVVDFLCGPWAQVVAHARITQGAGSKDATKYEALISALLWSVHPELTKNNIAKLTRLVPMLLATLRAGLDSLDFPATQTSAFLEVLMGLHQRAFRAGAAKEAPTDAAEAAQDAPLTHAQAGVGRHAQESEPWMAPQEAKDSNFMDVLDAPAASAPASQDIVVDMLAPVAASEPMPIGEEALDNLALGSWIELRTQGQWVRTQLTWASPHGTLFLFTNGFGATQSMTRRLRDKLLAEGNLRLVSAKAVVEGALNAVAQTAMRNSVDTTY